MTRVIASFLAGLLFGAGLIVAQMTNPSKVIGFLDITGNWDPSLAFVMVGAIGVYGLAYWLSRARHARPFLVDGFNLPMRRQIDRPLVVGALIFGAGWGLSGFCPGPALTSAGFGEPRVWVFVVAMLAGMMIYRLRGRTVSTASATTRD
ncbi:MAG TPA: YeeE/YedE family protein [Burkholderiales bacterium]|jgi:uncharacterized membrane protein YedE/YeeE